MIRSWLSLLSAPGPCQGGRQVRVTQARRRTAARLPDQQFLRRMAHRGPTAAPVHGVRSLRHLQVARDHGFRLLIAAPFGPLSTLGVAAVVARCRMSMAMNSSQLRLSSVQSIGLPAADSTYTGGVALGVFPPCLLPTRSPRDARLGRPLRAVDNGELTKETRRRKSPLMLAVDVEPVCRDGRRREIQGKDVRESLARHTSRWVCTWYTKGSVHSTPSTRATLPAVRT